MQHWINNTLDQERERWVLWVPVALSIGIGIFFALWDGPMSNPQKGFFFASILGLCTSIVIYKQPQSCIFVFLSWAIFWSCLGFILCALRTERMETHPLLKPLKPQWVTGTVHAIDHPTSAKRVFQRVVLDIHKKKNSIMPRRAIITIRTQCQPLYLGHIIRLKASLSPVQSAYLPTGYNHNTVCFFKGIGATGFAMSNPIVLSAPKRKWTNVRHHLTRTLYEKMPKKTAALACGMVTGDKAGIDQKTRDSFSESGLSHILAISGLHISSLTGMVFYLCRFFLARWGTMALWINIDRISGFLSIAITGFYLMISGQSISAIRSFSMSCSSIIALFALRKHHSIRTLMLCAAFFLILRPESILSLSYQMSFMAVLGLLSFSEKRNARNISTKRSRKRYKWNRIHIMKRTVYRSIASTAIATFSLSSITLFHFSSIPIQGVLSNLLAIPLTTFFILPLGFLCTLSMATAWPMSFLFHAWSQCLSILELIASFFSQHFHDLSVWIPRCNLSWFLMQSVGLLWFFIWRQSWKFWGIYLWIFSCIMGHTLRRTSPILVDPLHRLVGYADTKEKNLYVSSLGRGKWMTQKWSRAFGTPHIYAMPDPMNLSSYPGWSLSVCEEKSGLRVRFAHKESSKSWSLYVPPYGPVWIANPEKKINDRQ